MVQIKKKHDIDTFLKSPSGGAVLIYGPNGGLVRERADTLCQTITGPSQDPFATVTLNGDTIAQTPSRLFEEASTISLFGGQRVIRINGTTDKIADSIKALLDTQSPKNQLQNNQPMDNMVMFVAGDLPAKSKVRALFEKSKTHKSIACYQDDTKDIASLLNQRLSEDSITISRDAQQWILSHLGSDRGSTRNEIEKLALHAGQNGTITLDMAMLLVGDNQALSISEMVYLAFEGNHQGIDHHYDQLMAEGTSPIAILRAITNHLTKLQLIATTAQKEKQTVATIINNLRPPVFWKLKPRMENHAQRWPQKTLSEILHLSLQVEQQTKQTDYPSNTLTNRLLHQIAAWHQKIRK